MRGLTAIPSPSGHAELLLATVEGDAARIVRVDPLTAARSPSSTSRIFSANGGRCGLDM
jgi:hypothetical protein